MRAMVYLGRSENNLRESVLSFTMWIPVIEHRLLDLAIGALTPLNCNLLNPGLAGLAMAFFFFWL